MSELSSAADQSRGLALEAFWTTAVLSYARCFAHRANGANLTADDVAATGLAGDVTGWHQMLLKLRDHYADAVANPRERFSVGVSQNSEGAADGVAVTSARQPALDDVTVRQTGAIAYELARVVDRRIAAQQEAVLDLVRPMTRGELDLLPLMEVVAES
jgi:hypothetical protein